MNPSIPRAARAAAVAWSLLFVVGAGWLGLERDRLEKARHGLREAAAALDRLARADPPLDDAGDLRIAEQLAAAERELAARRPVEPDLAARDEVASWFEVESTAARIRRMAARSGVGLPPEDEWRFDDVGIVSLVELLVAAAPRTIVSWARRGARPGDPAGSGDAYEVRFVARTAAFRVFLTAAAAHGHAVVRRVEVVPAGDARDGAVGSVWSEFRVLLDLSSTRHAGGPGKPAEPAAAPAWPAPPAPVSAWSFELFTPPAMIRDPVSGEFRLESGLAPGPARESREEAVLLAVVRPRFRLQVDGFFGAPGRWFAVFAGPGSETRIARPGRHFDDLDLTFVGFETGAEASNPGDRPQGVFVLDERDGAELALRAGHPRAEHTPFALLAIGPAGREVEAWQGDVLELPSGRYRVDRLEVDPPRMVLVPETESGSIRPAIVLHPGDEGAGSTAESDRTSL